MAWTREFGFELCLKGHSEDIKSRADVIVLMLHWRLLRSSFLSIGDIHYTHDIPTEILPLNLGWLGDNDSYILKYIFKNNTYILAITVKDVDLDVKLQSEKDIVSITLECNNSVVDDDMVVNLQKCLKLCKQIDQCLIQEMLTLIDDEGGPLFFNTVYNSANGWIVTVAVNCDQ